MKRMRSLKAAGAFLFLMLAPMSLIWALETADLADFNKAHAFYRDSKFEDAAKIYETLSRKYPDQAVFFYDLGNAFHRSGKVGPAILAYERALTADPRNPDVRANLNYVRGLLEYRIQDKRNWYLKGLSVFLGFFKLEEALFLFLVVYFFWMAGLCYSAKIKKEPAWGWKRSTLAFLTVFCLLVLAAKTGQVKMFRDAIITAKEAQVRYGPSYTDQLAFRLGEGLKVHVVDSREDWSRIYLVNGEGGWISKDQLTEVRL